MSSPTRARSRVSGFVEIVVEDEGEGISPAIRKRVFTKFWKHGTRGGSGLGMYIAHGLVTAQGGRITITDAEGGGARIEVLWPVFEAEARSLPRLSGHVAKRSHPAK